MNQADLQKLFSENGVYLLENSNVPKSTHPVVVLGAEPSIGQRGACFVLVASACSQLSPDIESWAGIGCDRFYGPFSVQRCRQIEKHEATLVTLMNRAIFAKEQAMMLRDVCLAQGIPLVAQAAQEIMDTLDGVEETKPNT